MKSIYIYIHYPFCNSKCPYCSFYSLHKNLDKNNDDNNLLSLYKSHLDYYYNLTKDSVVQTIFFGGGTPSLASIKFLSDIIDYIYSKWSIINNPEISIEVNPFSSSYDKFLDYKNIGINRLSIGIQSLKDEELKFLGRIHSSKVAYQTIENAVKVFSNISADFIYGLPNHNLEIWEKNLEEIINLNLPHYSLYQLTIEKNTPFFSFIKRGKFIPADDLMQSKLFVQTRKIMRKNKLYPYEISNFAKTGFQSQHNMSYWTNQNYIGIGPSSESRINNLSFRNDITDWNKINLKKLTKIEKAEEIILTNLRSKYGLFLTDNVIKILNFDAIKYLNKFIKLNMKNNKLKMTEKGLLYFNSVIEKIIK